MSGNAGGVGQDVRSVLRLSFLEAVNGCSKEIKYEYFVREPMPGGRKGQFQKVRKSKTTKIDVPPGVDNGVTIRVPGKGAEGQANYPPGDLHIQLDVAEDPYFKRSGLDVSVDIPMTLSQAILGGSVDVLTLDGMISMKVPAGTQPDSLLSLKNKGIRDYNNKYRRGNQFVRLKLKIPTKLTPKQMDIIKEFDAAATSTASAADSSSAEAKAGSGAEDCKETFNVQSAWKRLREFLGTDKAAAGEAKEGAAAEAAKSKAKAASS
eukprot:TRINITY_DN536_c0_g1_i1.p2 TRINITY_DN536_c0_g1~~TRINITY_DN536_c0_g1_i1.p2  ORF type:complete len:303 (+),score=-11.05 TRINITY_DN536_c0_g1_i1:120-911(+)